MGHWRGQFPQKISPNEPGASRESGNPHITLSSIGWAKLGRKGWPSWLEVMTYLDRDAKSDLYSDRFTGWVNYLAAVEKARHHGKHEGIEHLEKPAAGRVWFPADIRKDDWFLIEHGNELPRRPYPACRPLPSAFEPAVRMETHRPKSWRRRHQSRLHRLALVHATAA